MDPFFVIDVMTICHPPLKFKIPAHPQTIYLKWMVATDANNPRVDKDTA